MNENILYTNMFIIASFMALALNNNTVWGCCLFLSVLWLVSAIMDGKRK